MDPWSARSGVPEGRVLGADGSGGLLVQTRSDVYRLGDDRQPPCRCAATPRRVGGDVRREALRRPAPVRMGAGRAGFRRGAPDGAGAMGWIGARRRTVARRLPSRLRRRRGRPGGPLARVMDLATGTRLTLDHSAVLVGAGHLAGAGVVDRWPVAVLGGRPRNTQGVACGDEQPITVDGAGTCPRSKRSAWHADRAVERSPVASEAHGRLPGACHRLALAPHPDTAGVLGTVARRVDKRLVALVHASGAVGSRRGDVADDFESSPRLSWRRPSGSGRRSATGASWEPAVTGRAADDRRRCRLRTAARLRALHDDVMDGSATPRRATPTSSTPIATRPAAGRVSPGASARAWPSSSGPRLRARRRARRASARRAALAVWNELRIELNIGQYLDIVGTAWREPISTRPTCRPLQVGQVHRRAAVARGRRCWRRRYASCRPALARTGCRWATPSNSATTCSMRSATGG